MLTTLFGLITFLQIVSATGAPEPPIHAHPPDYQFVKFEPFNASSPVGRLNSGLALDTDGMGFFTFGGVEAEENVTHFFNLSTSEWSTRDLPFSFSSGCVTQSEDGLVWLVNELHLFIFNLTTFQFTHYPNEKNIQTGGGYCAVANGNLYVADTCNTNFFVFSNGTWADLNTTSAPTRRSGSKLLATKEALFIVGGDGCGFTLSQFEVWGMNFSTSNWSLVTKNAKSGPLATSFHTAVIDTTSPDTSIVVFAGYNHQYTQLNNDLYQYNIPRNTWTEYTKKETDWPSARREHSAIWANGRMIVYAGKDKLQTLNDTWQLILNQDCFVRTTCESCAVLGCGWCGENDANYQCVAGLQSTGAYSPNACTSNDQFISDPDTCAPEFPGWIISLAIIGCIVLVGIVVYAVMRVRHNQGYQEL